MREIKFRAWDKTNKIIINDYFHIGNAGFVYVNKNTKCIIFYELMQFTGLQDKNGKDIYEGDILLVKQLNSREFKQDIQWNNNGFWLEDSFQGNFLPNKEFIEVIGNIYENPELLTN